MQIGGRNKINGNLDTKSVHLATDIFMWPKTNEVFVSDGYGNRRVIVFDANTGAFKRMWGAFGNPPTAVAGGGASGPAPLPSQGSGALANGQAPGGNGFGIHPGSRVLRNSVL